MHIWNGSVGELSSCVINNIVDGSFVAGTFYAFQWKCLSGCCFATVANSSVIYKFQLIPRIITGSCTLLVKSVESFSAREYNKKEEGHRSIIRCCIV